ncbi:helix-turn-helix transcriptional regulator [Microlunatus speluncae]|uniref:helix-turn-helix transcriptional regulator n=1 Tax=Microlunatus speluncae TaxID=2594267 RepID=UPI0013761248|nr:helix-turn-helix transcriptional regulator [Microlunatus speluncae]
MAPLIGRTAELDRLADLAGLNAAEAGSGIGVLSGDAGIGKTRLLAEFAELAGRRGRRVLVGHCVDLADSPLPYLPFLEIMAALAEAGGSDRLTAQQRLLAEHPGLAPLLDRTGDAGHRPNRGALIESVWSVLNESAREQPLLVIIEDAHWADQSSLELISYLLARPCPAPVSIVVSYRSDDLVRDHPLRPVLASWVRLRAVGRLELEPLSEAAVRELVATLEPRAAAPGALSEEGFRQLISWSGGNAFFVEELLNAGGEGSGLPDDLAAVLLLRLERLGPVGQRVARALSVAGHPVDYALLGRVTALPAEELDPALREATQSRLLVAGEEDRFTFRHSLLAEAIRRDLLPGERTRLHRAYLTALTDPAVGAANDAELARHALAAGDHELALPASIRAAEASVAAAGPAEALRHYEVALRLAAEPGAAANAAELAVRASECALAAGQFHRAWVIVRAALEAADLAPLDRAGLLLALAGVGMQTDHPVEVAAATTEALSLVPPEPSVFRTRVLAAHVLAMATEYHDDEAMALAEAAAEQAAAFELPDALVAIRTAQSWIAAKDGDPKGMRELLREAVLLARRHHDPAELRALHNLGGMALDEGDLVEARARYEECTRRGAELGLRYSPFPLEARTHAGIVAFQQGDWDAVLALSDCANEAPPEPARAALTAVAVTVVAARGGDAGPLLAASRSGWAGNGHVIMLACTAAIEWYGNNGDPVAAERFHDEAVAAVAEVWRVPDFQGRIRLAAQLIGQYANRLDAVDPADRGALVAHLVGLAERAVPLTGMGRHPGVQGLETRAWLARLAAETLRLRWLAGIDRPEFAELITAWEATLEGFRAYPNLFELARSEARLAALLHASGDRSRAQQLADSARSTANRLGAAPLLAELDGIARTASAVSVLTPRERQVLTLVAEGRSNGEVAAALVISTKTASVHVSNILAKLGAASRTEAAAVARRRGLIDSG